MVESSLGKLLGSSLGKLLGSSFVRVVGFLGFGALGLRAERMRIHLWRQNKICHTETPLRKATSMVYQGLGLRALWNRV